MLKTLLENPEFDYVTDTDKTFCVAFDAAMQARGYDFGGAIGSGYCWSRHMIVYARPDVKNRKITARLYLKANNESILRLYFSNLDKQRAFLEQAPPHIKEVFDGPFGTCNHCKTQKADGRCGFRKTYTLDGRLIEKCNGNTFWFFQPKTEHLDDYVALFDAFYAPKRGKKVTA